MIFIPYMNCTCSWEAQIGRLWIGITKPRYRGKQWWKHLGFIRIAEKDDDED